MRSINIKPSFWITVILFFAPISFGQATIPSSPNPSITNPVFGKAIFLGKPVYPPEAHSKRLNGKVNVKVQVDENGNVISAKAITGNPIFYPAAEVAALQSKFTPATLDGKPIKILGTIVFNFIRYTDWESVGSILSSLQDIIPAIQTGEANKEIIWTGFEKEKTEFFALQEDESTTGKASRATKLINILRDKLKSLEPTELWYFNLGYTLAKISTNAERTNGQTDFQNNLRELARLVQSPPNGIPLERLETLAKAAKYAEVRNLSKNQRLDIVKMLIKSRNQFLNNN
ncbi:MAG: energy transducer TonB [Pyrinomonadaceae bacterium]